MNEFVTYQFVAGIAFGAGVIVGGLLMWLAVDWVYRKIGRPNS